MFDAAGVVGMLKWVQAASLQYCVIGHHMELKEHIKERNIAELKEKLVRLRESYARKVYSLEEKVKKAEDKYLAR